ncbi:MAG: hypothetical protein O7D30_00890, partial [Rickettsia endosymbiont of Ixodes persulcatus]|nr:hypothetical protein [Rickettsia endosymbiont of Ixodes persulcatus]
ILGPGMFFMSPKVLFEKIKNILLALVTACFTLYLMYNFSNQLAEFATEDEVVGVTVGGADAPPLAATLSLTPPPEPSAKSLTPPPYLALVDKSQ